MKWNISLSLSLDSILGHEHVQIRAFVVIDCSYLRLHTFLTLGLKVMLFVRHHIGSNHNYLWNVAFTPYVKYRMNDSVIRKDSYMPIVRTKMSSGCGCWWVRLLALVKWPFVTSVHMMLTFNDSSDAWKCDYSVMMGVNRHFIVEFTHKMMIEWWFCPYTVEEHRIGRVKGGVRSSTSHGDNMTNISLALAWRWT